MVQSHPLFHNNILLSQQKRCLGIFVFKKGTGNFFCSLPPKWCHPLWISAFPPVKKSKFNFQRCIFRGSKSIPCWEFAPGINPSPCLPSPGLSSTQHLLPREGTQVLLSLLTHKHSRRVKKFNSRSLHPDPKAALLLLLRDLQLFPRLF